MDCSWVRVSLVTVSVGLFGCPADDAGSAETDGQATTGGVATGGVATVGNDGASDSGGEAGSLGNSTTSTGDGASGSQGTSGGGDSSGGSDSGDGSGDSSGGSGVCPDCGDASWCDWEGNSCGTSEFDKGLCERLPDGCDDIDAPVCGCNGRVYGNACEAQRAGVDIDPTCRPPAGSFACGEESCDPGSAYCQVQVSDVVGLPNLYECVLLPLDCGKTPSCECLADEPCAEFSCEPSGEDGLVIVCPGG